MAAKLQDASIDSFTIFEKADDVGGTWRENTHPSLSWRITTTEGEETFDVLGVPRYPEVRGWETFAGPAFHSSHWDHSVSLPDKWIGLIGTGSTGVQITAEPGGKVRQLKGVQRTAQWIYPMPDPRCSRLTRAALSRRPRLNALGYWFCVLAFRGIFGRAPIRPGFQRRLVQAECR